ncbi:MAG TPA: YhdP family protein, partial [Ideonella sp.]|nr:YhdP family protein [Ideonella sp.]
LQARWHTGPGAATPAPATAPGSGPPAAAAHGAGARFPGQIDLSGKLSQGQATAVARYLPLGVSAHARDYVARAVLGGTVRNVQFKAKGDLWEFPFAQARSGEFRIAGQVEDATLAYVPATQPGESPPWPPFTQLSGELVFEREAMSIRKAQAQLWGIALKDVNGGIANLVHEPTLVIEGGGRGPLADALRFVAATPVDGWTQHALQVASGNGAADLALALNIPLHDVDRTTVRGSVSLLGNDVRLRPDVPLLAGAKARIDFTQQGFGVSAGSARALGGELAFDGGSAPDGAWRFNAQGTLSAEGLRRTAELGDATRLAGLMNGQTAYRLQLGIRNGHSEFNLTSPLTGMALDLPAPLKKTAETALQLRLQSTLQETAGAPLRDTLRLELGNLLQAEYQRDLSQGVPKVLRGAISVGAGESLPATQPGSVVAQLRLPALDLDAWKAVGQKLLGSAPAGGPAPGAAAGAAVGATAGYLPSDLSLRTQELVLAGGHRLSQLDASVQHRSDADGEVWRATLQASQAQGRIEYRPAATGAPAGRVYARLARLAVPAPEGSGNADSNAGMPESTDSVPALDIVVDEFEWRGKPLGKLEIEARSPGGAGRDWRLYKLNLTLPEARLLGSGSWSAGPRKRMAMDFKLELSDSGALVERLGMGRTVRGGKGRLQGQLAWNGSPLSPDWAQVEGMLQLALDSGQFLKAEPGAARLLGVLSLQALPRRLTLDFRDVFQEGFAFDNVSGDLQLAGGVARTNNLRIRGVQAVVLMEGSADLQRETQDLRVVVVPEVNAGTASLAYAAINPAIGLGTFLAQVFLRKPLMQAGTREFRVTGPWGEPVVDTVDRKLTEPLPDLDGPAAAASMPLPP